jgi:hypothetical protein
MAGDEEKITITCSVKRSVDCLGTVAGTKEDLKQAFWHVPWEGYVAECGPCGRARTPLSINSPIL